MAYVKKSPEEVSAARSRAGRLGNIALQRKGKSFGGRPKGVKNKMRQPKADMHNLKIGQQDWEVFNRLATLCDISLVQFVHRIAESLRMQNPHLFMQTEVEMPVISLPAPADTPPAAPPQA